MTQQHLADELGMPQPTIARIERGTVLPRTSTLMALVEATGHRLTVQPMHPELPAIDTSAIDARLLLQPSRRTQQALSARDRRPERRPTRVLSVLRRFGVPFVLIGELAEAVRGAPGTIGRTIEVVHAETETARQRIGKATDEMARLGLRRSDLILLTASPADDDFETLLRTSTRMLVDVAIYVRVASLEDLVRQRLANGTDEDRAAASVLEAVSGRIAERPHLLALA